MNKKASIQISVNFLVVIIISIIIMGFGFVLVKKMVSGGEDNIENIDSRLKEQTERMMLRDGSLVTIPIIQKEIRRGKLDTFAVGILNVKGSQVDFNLDVKFDDAFTFQGNPITDDDNYIEVIDSFYSSGIEIENNAVEVLTVPIKVNENAPSGEYIFNVYVGAGSSCNNDDPFDCYDGSIHKIYVKVP